MASCKNCVHVEVCCEKYLHVVVGMNITPRFKYKRIEQECEHFKDRARFVELPCKVGDKVYCGSFGKIMEDEIKCIIIDADETRMILKRGISYDIDMINQMFFFTREEAEQAVKEREENA